MPVLGADDRLRRLRRDLPVPGGADLKKINNLHGRPSRPPFSVPRRAHIQVRPYPYQSVPAGKLNTGGFGTRPYGAKPSPFKGSLTCCAEGAERSEADEVGCVEWDKIVLDNSPSSVTAYAVPPSPLRVEGLAGGGIPPLPVETESSVPGKFLIPHF